MSRQFSFVRFPFRFIVLILFATGLSTTTPAADSAKPNILIIMADDLGYSDLGCYGGEIATPHLDSIAESGLRFSQFYNTARCWPTRGALLTGFYAQQIGRDTIPGLVSGNRGRRPKWAPLLPNYLKPAGYRCYHTGKWHVDGMPLKEGFDRSYYLKDQSRFFSPKQHWKDDQPLPAVPRGTGFYGTTALADHVIETLREHGQKHTGKPFFHYLAFAAPHFPLHALPEDIAIYDSVYQEGWDKIRARRWERIRQLGLLEGNLSEVEKEIGPPYHFPDHLKILGTGEVNKPVAWESLTQEQKDFQAKKMALHAAMIHRMDFEIGRVFAQIKAMEQWENTLIIFLSDNGASAEIMVRGDGHDPAASPGSAETYLCLGPGWSTVCNTPFRRHKTWTHEGGVSTPLIISWPRGISEKGKLRNTVGHVIDIVPTLLQITGAKDAVLDGPEFPGRSLVPALTGEAEVNRDFLWWYHDNHKAVFKDGWKAVAENGGEWDLFDLGDDRAESRDISGQYPEKVIELVRIWDDQLDAFRQLSLERMTPQESSEHRKAEQNRGAMKKAQRDALPPRKQTLFNADKFEIDGRPAFVMLPGKEDPTSPGEDGKPWIFYAPALAGTPDKAESWMHKEFLKAGIAVAGVDVGEAYGSPLAFPFFEKLYAEMERRGFSGRPVLLGRSRGGLWVSSWAISQPGRVRAIAGIYPVFDFTTYPGIKRAASAYERTAPELEASANELNPIEKAAILARAKIPVYIIHGVEDRVVPMLENSARLEKIYRESGAGKVVTLRRVEKQGHSYWPGFFLDRELVDFVIRSARRKR